MDHGVVGRERELGEAAAFLADVADGPCGLLLRGEPGIGKTTIWSAVIAEAIGGGYRVITARPSEPEADLAFMVLTDLLGGVEEAVLEPLPPAQRVALEQAVRRVDRATAVDPVAVALATAAVLRTLSKEGPAIVAVDDLQWVDSPSHRALTSAVRRLGDARVGLVATVRSGWDDDLATFADDRSGRIRRLEIGGLDRRSLAELVLARTRRRLTPAQLEGLEQLSGGSPYYALELASTGDPELGVPENLTGALRARLTALSAAARATGLALATLGRFDEGAVGSPADPGATELRAAGIMDDRTGAPWFAHPLLASTLLAMHAPEERRQAHLRAADRVADPDERALHLGRGTDGASEDVAAELERAADRLDRRGAPETAASLAERAATLTPPEDVGGRTRRLILAADLYQAAGEGRTRVLPLLERLAAELEPGPERARSLVRLGWLGAELDTMTTSDAACYFERALAEAEGAPDVTAAAHVALARILGLGGDFRSWLQHAELAVAAGAPPGSGGGFPSPFGELGFAMALAGRGLDESLFAQGIELEATRRSVGEPYHSPHVQYAWALLYAGELSRARTIFLDQLALSTELERVRSVAGCLTHLIELEVRAGDLAQAETYAAEFAYLDRLLRGELAEEWYPGAIVAVHAGRVDDARRMLRSGIDYSDSIESTVWRVHHLGALGLLELSLGNLGAAREALSPLPPLLREMGLGEWSVHPVHPDAIETHVGLGELDEAAALTAELEEYGRRLDRPWGLAAAARSRALIASARGSADEALAEAERALLEHARLDWPFERARTLLVTGGILRRLGRRRDAAAALAEAGSLFGSVRNPLWLAKVRAEERRLGGRRPADDTLTSAEERVARLAVQGLRNAEIASILFVTPKTVEWTLSRVYRKLGVRSRTELASQLTRSTEG